MTFERPDLLGLAPVIVLLLSLAVVNQWRRGRRLVEAYGGPGPALRLLGTRLERFPTLRLTVLLSAAMALVLAAAGPERAPANEVQPVTPIDLVVAVDVSLSMTAADVTPSRIERARELVRQLVEGGVADRVALSLFADWPYPLVPLTGDGSVVSFFTPWISPQLLAERDQGTSLAALVGHARAAWQARARPDAFPVVLIVSDGEAHGAADEVLDSVSVATRDGLRIWTAGVGSGSGGPLFVSGSDGAPLLDGAGEPVVARYEPELLRDIAARGGGTFYDIGEDRGVRSIVTDLSEIRGEVRSDLPRGDRSMLWLVLAAVAFLALEALLDAGLGRRAPSEGRVR